MQRYECCAERSKGGFRQELERFRESGLTAEPEPLRASRAVHIAKTGGQSMMQTFKVSVVCPRWRGALVQSLSDTALGCGIAHLLLCSAITIAVAGTAYAQQPKPVAAEGLFATPADGGVRRWQVAAPQGLRLFDAPHGRALTGPPIANGSILRSFGCVVSRGEVWCDVNPLLRGHRGFAQADDLVSVAGPDGGVARGVDDSARRAKRKRFDATAEIPCAQEQGEALGICAAGVARSGGGDATVSATFGNGFSRLLFFAHGDFIRANSTMSGVGTDIDWQIENGVHIIRVDDQRFDVPVSFVVGP